MACVALVRSATALVQASVMQSERGLSPPPGNTSRIGAKGQNIKFGIIWKYLWDKLGFDKKERNNSMGPSTYALLE